MAGPPLRGATNPPLADYWETLLAVDLDPWACRTYSANFPAVPVRTAPVCDVLADLPAADVLLGGPPCFGAGTLVLCRRGFLPIESVRIGDEVLTHMRRWRPVTDTMSREAPTVTLKGQGHHGIVATADHPFYACAAPTLYNPVSRQCLRTFGPMEWTPAGVMEGRFWSSPAAYPGEPVPQIELSPGERNGADLTPGFMWLVGAWLGNGWVGTGQKAGRPEGESKGEIVVCAGFHKADEMARQLAFSGLAFARQDQRTVARFVANSKAVARWLVEHFGRYADGKRLPAWALGMSSSFRDELLNGYEFTDGSWDGDNVRFTTVSRELAYGVACLVRADGKGCSVRLQENARERCVIEGREVSERPYYTVTAYARSKSSIERDGLRLGKVRSVEPTGRTETVYDLTVEEDHSFVADGLIVHNCQPFSRAGKGHGAADARDCVPDFCAAAERVRPRMFLMENVGGLLAKRHRPYFDATARRLEEAGYAVEWRLADSVSFGVPQFRRRVWVWGVRADLYAAGVRHRWPEPTHAWPPPDAGAGLLTGVTVGQALGIDGCLRMERGAGMCDRSGGRRDIPTTEPAPLIAAGSKGSGPRYQVIQYDHGVCDPAAPAPTVKAGWREDSPAYTVDGRSTQGVVIPYRWSDAMLARHPPADPAAPSPTIQAKWLKGGAEGLLAIDSPARTINGQSREPIQGWKGKGYVRRLTPGECARLQSVPDDFVWPFGVTKTNAYRIVGNGIACGHAAALSAAFAAADPDARTVVDLFCGGGLGACGWHGRAWRYDPAAAFVPVREPPARAVATPKASVRVTAKVPAALPPPPPSDAPAAVAVECRLSAAEAADAEYLLGRLADLVARGVVTDRRCPCGGPCRACRATRFDAGSAAAVVDKLRRAVALACPAGAFGPPAAKEVARV